MVFILSGRNLNTDKINKIMMFSPHNSKLVIEPYTCLDTEAGNTPRSKRSAITDIFSFKRLDFVRPVTNSNV